LRLDEPYISAQHALLRWDGDRWTIKDRGSLNGTFCNHLRLPPGEERVVTQGDVIAFGKVDQAWSMSDASGPVVMAFPVHGGGDPVALDGSFLALPSSDEPRATIYCSEGLWTLEHTEGSRTPVHNLEEFEVDGRAWRFSCPEAAAPTGLDPVTTALEIRRLRLDFAVSRDEEHVALTLRSGGHIVELGARNHNFLLLTLARKRSADAALGMDDGSSGWIALEALARDPSMAPPQLNIDVFRIRRQFAESGVLDAVNIIERDARGRRLRIGTSQVSITVL
jgi:hypothetical protein